MLLSTLFLHSPQQNKMMGTFYLASCFGYVTNDPESDWQTDVPIGVEERLRNLEEYLFPGRSGSQTSWAVLLFREHLTQYLHS